METESTDVAKLNLHEIAELIVQFRDERDWQQFHSIPQMLLALFTEAAELSEHFQWLSEEQIATRLEQNGEAIGDELADVLYWTLLIAHDLKINLADAFQKKLAKNRVKYPADLVRGSNKKYKEY